MRRAAAIVVAAGLLLPAVGAAHHTTSTSRAGGGTAGPSLGAELGPALPRLEARIAHELVVFDRRLEGTTRLATADTVLINTLSPSLTLGLDTGTSMQVRLPVGLVWTRPEAADARTSAGLGDLELSASQDILRLFTAPSPSAPRLVARAGLIAPTGRYARDAALSLTDLEARDGGTIDVITYDIRASLGAGAWTALAALAAGLRPHPRLALSLAAQLAVPIDRTPDDIRWGLDVTTTLGATFAPILDRLTLGVSLDHRHHTEDRVPGVDEDTGEAVRSAVGGRDELGLGLAARVGLTAELSCAARVHVPVWQRAGGVQLVETVATQLGCGYAWSL